MTKTSKLFCGAVALATVFFCCAANAEKFYCRYCGIFRSSVQSLTAGRCPRHPAGASKGRHALYQGNEKAQYTCEFCGIKRNSISSLTAGNCPRHPAGTNRGRHSPAL